MFHWRKGSWNFKDLSVLNSKPKDLSKISFQRGCASKVSLWELIHLTMKLELETQRIEKLCLTCCEGDCNEKSLEYFCLTLDLSMLYYRDIFKWVSNPLIVRCTVQRYEQLTYPLNIRKIPLVHPSPSFTAIEKTSSHGSPRGIFFEV